MFKSIKKTWSWSKFTFKLLIKLQLLNISLLFLTLFFNFSFLDPDPDPGGKTNADLDPHTGLKDNFFFPSAEPACGVPRWRDTTHGSLLLAGLLSPSLTCCHTREIPTANPTCNVPFGIYRCLTRSI